MKIDEPDEDGFVVVRKGKMYLLFITNYWGGVRGHIGRYRRGKSVYIFITGWCCGDVQKHATRYQQGRIVVRKGKMYLLFITSCWRRGISERESLLGREKCAYFL